MVLGALVALAGQAAVIYKWTDSDGVVHYSDQAVPGAEKIFTAPAPAGASGPRPGVAAPPGKKATLGMNLTQFAVAAPLADQTFFGDDVIGVSLALTPALKPGQTITWHLNGKQLEEPPDAVQFSMQGLDRGTYVIAATLSDPETGDSQNTESVSFYVRQPSLLSPQHKNP